MIFREIFIDPKLLSHTLCNMTQTSGSRNHLLFFSDCLGRNAPLLIFIPKGGSMGRIVSNNIYPYVSF